MTDRYSSSRARRGGRWPHARTALVAAALTTICGAPFAAAANRDPLLEGVRNGTTASETEIIGRIGASAKLKGGYVTRQSNLSLTGGGAIYGCRASLAPTSEACVRANNLSSGRAFELATTTGPVVGTITAGGGGDARKPFTTNATGVATGLNADRLDSMDAAEIIAAARAKAGLDADTLDGLDASAFLPSASHVVVKSMLAVGAERVVATRDSLSLVHQCVDVGGGSIQSRIIARTTAPGAAMDGSDVHSVSSGGFLEPATSADDSELVKVDSAATVVRSDIDDGFVVSADGDYLGLDGESTALGVRFGGNDCTAIGHVLVA